jgi:muramoyltetrapeptide carboxypeptidase
MLEEIDEPGYRIDRMLNQMKLAGCFDNLAGLMLGAFKNCGKKEQIYNIFAEIFADKKIPILAGFKVGHGRSNMTFPFGLDATLDTDEKVLAFHDT